MGRATCKDCLHASRHTKSYHASGALISTLWHCFVALEVCQGLAGGRFSSQAAPLDFPHEHRSLNCGNAEIGQFFGIGLPAEPSPGLLLDKKSSQFVFHQFKNETEVLAD